SQDLTRFYEIAVATDPDYDDYYQAGIYRLARGEPGKSVELLEQVIKVRPEVNYYLGVAYYRLGDYDHAARCFETFSRTWGDVWQSYYYLSIINLKQNNIDKALQYLTEMPDSDAKQRVAGYIADYEKLNEARSEFSETRYEEAIELYSQVDDFFGYREIGLALAYAKVGKHKESVELLDTVINRSEDETLIRMGLFEAGKELAWLRNMRKAKHYLREYLKHVPDDNAEFLMGKILSDEAKFDSANIFFKDLPDSVDAFLFFKGRTEYFLGSWGTSEEKLLKHRELFPVSSFADRSLYILASIGFKRKAYRNAVSFWQELVDSFPKSLYVAAALKGIGNSYFNIHEYRSALKAYYRVAGFQPSEEISAEVTLKIYETRYYLHEYPSLLDALRRYVRENPDSELIPKTNLRIAKIFYEDRRYYQSINELDKIIEGGASSSVTVEALMQRVQVSQAMESRFELLSSLRNLLVIENAAQYRLYAANELGAAWLEEMRYDSALYYYNLLLDSETYRENAILKIANIYDQLGQSKESTAMVERLISEYPKSMYLPDAFLLKSKALRNQGDYETAIAILLHLISNVGDRADVYMQVGDLYFETEEFLRARHNYLKACEMFKQNREDAAHALILAGDASLAIGDKLKGKEYYLQANMIAESHMLKNKAMQKLTTLDEE
ncbi:tetratricopeptide repeat protein, partial [candidate division WOR-3 bacterium]|nr:tetratricopeptide repeat protein [candidate division WOR-3 bacterium]